MICVTTALSIVILALTFILPLWRILPFASQTPYIALHYNIYMGVDRFGPVYQILFIPFLGLGFLVLNLVIEAKNYSHQKILSYFFAITTPLIELILLVAMGLIVLIQV